MHLQTRLEDDAGCRAANTNDSPPWDLAPWPADIRCCALPIGRQTTMDYKRLCALCTPQVAQVAGERQGGNVLA
jgi:hypothetical protein